jgi:outer membrane protein TolC
MKRLLILLTLFPLLVTGQEITLDSCISAAKQNWPAFKKQLTINSQRQLINETLNKNYLPKLNLSGQATYQSEVVTFPEVPTMPGFFPVIPQDNYSVEIGINQIIWDGGTVKSAKEVQYAANDIEAQKLNVETYGLIGKINQLYSNYLYLNKSKSILQISENELEKNLTTLNSAYENGTLLKSDLDNIKAEKLKLQKELIAVESSRLNVIHSINLITGLNLDTTYRFTNPVIQSTSGGIRPELALMDAQVNYTNTTISKFKANRMPKFLAFGRAGYGRPGYDFLNTDLHGYYMVGARFTWEIFDWNLFKKQKEQITLQQQIIRDSKATLEKQISLEKSQYLFEIAQLKKQIEIDKEIAALKMSVYKSAESKMNNGSITSTEYLKLFNEWKRAKLTAEMDKLKLTTAQLNHNHAQGGD